MKILPKIKGKYIENAPLAKMTWFGVGGNADVLFEPKDRDDLVYFLKNRDKCMPITILGGGANIIIRDGGIRGAVIHIGNLNDIRFINGMLKVQCGCLNSQLFNFCKEHDIKDLEFLGTIPGTIGGAIRMNAGCYGQYISDVVLNVETIDFDGNIKEISNDKMGFGYRTNNMPIENIFVEATFKVEFGKKEQIEKKFEEYMIDRKEKHPQRVKTAGSTFKNPKDQPAWKLIDEAGCRGLSLGGAQMSEKHPNFMINTGNATAKDLEELGELVRKKVKEKTGILLEWEVQRVGEKLKVEN